MRGLGPNLDALINDSILISVQRARPRFRYHLQERGLAAIINSASEQELDALRSTGDLTLHTFLARYVHQWCTPETPVDFHGTLKTRVYSAETFKLLILQGWPGALDSEHFHSTPIDTIFLFMGVLAATSDVTECFDWFLETFLPILSGVTSTYRAHQEERQSTVASSKKRRRVDGEVFETKRRKLTHSERRVVYYAKVKSMLHGLAGDTQDVTDSPRAMTPDLANVLDRLDFAAILRPYLPILPCPAPLPYLARPRGLWSNIYAFTQHEIAEFRRTAFPEGKGMFTQIYEAYMSSLSVNPEAEPPRTKTFQSTEYLASASLSSSFRRSRAPSPPSPRTSWSPIRLHGPPSTSSATPTSLAKLDLTHAVHYQCSRFLPVQASHDYENMSLKRR
ncbi:hypothetical protein B0H11DRAFT_2271820 [Mycena galericulata]|nr:hypothetical protein B0H11DRAFT_2271820 [Mycena galericulata]